MSPQVRAKELSHAGKTYTEIAKALTKEGMAPPDGEESWTRSGVERLLSSEGSGDTDPEASVDEASVDETVAEATTVMPSENVSPDAQRSTVTSMDAESPIEVQRICRKCSAQVTTAATACPICGTPYMKPGLQRKHVVVGLTAIALVVAAIVGAILYSTHQENVRADKAEAAADRRAEEKAEAEEAAAEEERRAEEEAEAAAEQAAADLQAQRAAGARELEKTITKDAKKEVAAGTLTGPILHTSCTPVAGGVDDSTATTESYDCLAVTTKNSDGTESGYRYTASVNYDTGYMSWRIGG